MWISRKQVVVSALWVWGCGSHSEAQNSTCADMQTSTQPMGETTQFGQTGTEVVDSVSGTHVFEVPSDTDPDRKLTVVVTPISGAEFTEQVSSVSVCQRASVPVHLSVQLDDGSIAGELDAEALLQNEVGAGGMGITRTLVGEVPASAFTRFPPGEFPERVVTHITIEVDGSLAAGSLVTKEDRPEADGEQPTLRGRSVLSW